MVVKITYTFYDPNLLLPSVLRGTKGIDTIHLGDPSSPKDFFNTYRVNRTEVRISLRPLAVFDDGVYSAEISAETEKQATRAADEINTLCKKTKSLPITRLRRTHG